MKNNDSRNRLFRRWLLIEMCFLAFMTIISTGVYLYADHHIKHQLDELHLSALDRTAAEVTAVLDGAQSAADEYFLNPTVRMLAATGISSGQRELAELTDAIKQTNSASDAVAEIIIYLKDDDVFISSAGVLDSVLFSELYDGGDLIERIATPDAAGRFSPVYYGRGGYDTAVYAHPLLGGGYICAVIDSSRIEQILSDNLQGESNTFFVLTSANELLFALDSGIATQSSPLLSADGSGEAQNITVSGREYVCFSTESSGLKTVSLIDRNNYLAGHLRIQRTAMLILAVSVLLGLGISILYHAI